MYVVFGASGNTGAVVAQTLIDAGKKVRVVGRDPAKLGAWKDKGAEVFAADLAAGTNLQEALTGASGAYVLLPPDATSTGFIARGKAIADALAAAIEGAKVPHVVLLSSVGAHLDAATGPIRTVAYAEKRFATIPTTVFTYLRAAYFMENLLANLHPMKADGVLPSFSAITPRFDMVATRDIGAEAARSLLAPPAKSEVVELAGAAPASVEDAAKAFAAALGRPVQAILAPIEAMVPTLTGFGISADVAGLYREMTEGFDAGLIVWEGKGRSVRGATSIEAFAKQAVG